LEEMLLSHSCVDVMLDQFTLSDMDVFYSGLALGVRAKAKRLSTLRAFFRFCVNRKWITENLVSSDIRPPIGSHRVANKFPYKTKNCNVLSRLVTG